MRHTGVFAPHVSSELGDHRLDMRGRAAVFEEAGYSLLGPLALNIAAPDEGNMHMLELIATEEQKRRYLAPLAAGAIRSFFAMTEPAPGAGSDPDALATRDTRVRGGWRIDGRKWFITGAAGAAFAICMARTAGEPGDRSRATMFLVDADNPGMRVGRHIPTLDESLYGGHLESRRTASVRLPAGRPRHGPADDRRQPDRYRGFTRSHPAGLLGARPGP
jgi:acyl-CoA dehydrogenase